MSHDVHAALRRVAEDFRGVERTLILLFAEVMVNQLYRDVGFASMAAYSEAELGFSAGKTKQLIRLAARLQELPKLKHALATGEVTWTGARETTRVATPETEAHWVEEAKRSSRRELVKKIDRAKAVATRERKRKRTKQAELVPAPGGTEPLDVALDVPRSVTFRFTGEQYDRYQALIEARRKAGCRSNKEELVLEALAATPVGASSTAPHHKIVTTVCPTCSAAACGGRPVPLAELAARMEDAEVVDADGGTRRTIPPKTRARVMARDGHTCQAKGCGNTRFLEVHHKTPVAAGGTNEPENLITLCSGCHRALHERKSQLVAWQQGTRVPGELPGEPAGEPAPTPAPDPGRPADTGRSG